jgi:hypothetical protein
MCGLNENDRPSIRSSRRSGKNPRPEPVYVVQFYPSSSTILVRAAVGTIGSIIYLPNTPAFDVLGTAFPPSQYQTRAAAIGNHRTAVRILPRAWIQDYCSVIRGAVELRPKPSLTRVTR